MKRNRTLLDLAFADLVAAKQLSDNALSDEIFLNYAGHHLQQAVEKCIKYQLDQLGADFPKTHNISQLILFAKKENLDLIITDYIDEHSEMFTAWEAMSRYITDYGIEKKKIDRALKEVKAFLELVKGKDFSMLDLF